jgi:hypothetical protein
MDKEPLGYCSHFKFLVVLEVENFIVDHQDISITFNTASHAVNYAILHY